MLGGTSASFASPYAWEHDSVPAASDLVRTKSRLGSVGSASSPPWGAATNESTRHLAVRADLPDWMASCSRPRYREKPSHLGASANDLGVAHPAGQDALGSKLLESDLLLDVRDELM